MKKTLLATTTSLALVGASSAAYLFDNFDNGVNGATMGSPWTTTGNGIPSAATYVEAYFDANTANLQGSIGGYPGNSVPGPLTVNRNTVDGSIPLVGSTMPTYFEITTAILDTTEGQNAREVFQYHLIGTGAQDLFTLTFTPLNPTPSDPQIAPNNTAQWQVAWASALGTGATIGTMSEYYVNGLGSPQNISTFRVDFSQGTGTDVDFKITNASNEWFGVLDGTNANTFSIAKFTAEVNQGNTESGNYMVFDNLTVIPEPSSTLLICLAGLGLVTRRKRA